MGAFNTLAESRAPAAEMPWETRAPYKTVHDMLTKTAAANGNRDALTFQITSEVKDKGETLSWNELAAKVNQAANLFRSLGINDDDTVAYILPNANETVITMLGGMVAGVVAPINPLLEPAQMASILKETGAKVVVTLRAFPKTDVPQKVAEALTMAPDVHTVLEIDLLRYLTPPKSWIVPLIRPKNPVNHGAKVLNFNDELARQPKALQFEDHDGDRIAAYFHTGGTTGMPKVAQHSYAGMVYNGWVGSYVLYKDSDIVLCPLPFFHVFACHVIMMGALASGAHIVMPTPAGYRGDGVFDNFWQLVEKYRATFLIGVPTAISALMQRPVNADVSSVKLVFSGSSPLPVELYKRFEDATGTTIVEGYGLTEATCLVSGNPPFGEKKIGSVGLPFPYTDVRILQMDNEGGVLRECDVDEVGEICVSNPGVVVGKTYTDATKNVGLFADQTFLRTGDLGRIDQDGYLFITGRAKDLIIRGGHNIDPALIEEALAGHPAVAMAGAIGQPDAHAGEIPCVYVELVAGASVTTDELMQFTKDNVTERAAHPKHVEILDELPKTAVGKVFKPDLRKRAIQRIYNEELAAANLACEVSEVFEDKKRGLVARLKKTGTVDEAAVAKVLGNHTRPWEWS